MTVPELAVTTGILAVVTAVAVATASASPDLIQAAGAARYLAGRLHQVRAASLSRGVNVALVFRVDGADIRYAVAIDGNRNGVRSADVTTGTDRLIEAWERIDDHFSRMSLGLAPGITDPDSGQPLAGSPVRLGGSSVLAFSPDGGSTSGTVYLRSRAGVQYAVRVLGTTGRTRILRFDPWTRQWESP